MANIPIKVFFNCVFLVVITYGFIQLYIETIYTILPTSILISGLVFVFIYFFRVPQPEQTVVDEVLGKDPSIDIVDNNNPWVMRSAAHRGAGLDAPENSLAAFKLCSEKGCEAIEFDVRLTGDDVAVVFHDDTLDRMTDATNVSIDKLTYDELKSYDISVKHSFRERFVNTNIPTLNEAVAQCLACGQRMFIDVKVHNRKVVKIVLDLFEQRPELLSKVVVSSFYPQIIYLIRRANPKIVCSVAWRPYFFSATSYSALLNVMPPKYNVWYKTLAARAVDVVYAWALPRFVYYMLGLSAVLLHKDVISCKTILQWRNRGVRVLAWTVNHPVEKQYFSRILKLTYLTDTLTGEGTAHLNQSH